MMEALEWGNGGTEPTDKARADHDAIGENSYAIDRATLQSWLVQGRMEPTRFRRTKRQLCAIYGV